MITIPGFRPSTKMRIALDKRIVHERVKADMCKAGVKEFFAEYRFRAPRRWKFDYAILAPDMIAIEVEGGVWTQGRHTRGSGFLRDIEKYNTAALMGWAVIRVTPDQVLKGHVLKWLT